MMETNLMQNNVSNLQMILHVHYIILTLEVEKNDMHLL